MARGTLTSELRSVADDPDAVLAYVEAQGWGDGLPVIPPTESRVQAMLDATPLPPAHVVGVVEPRRGEATVEKIAVNAVLAGCRPEYFAVVLAAVEAVCDPRFNLYALNTTTCCATPALMVNGPARRTLGIEYGYSLSRTERPRQRDHRPRTAPGDAQRGRRHPGRGVEVGLRAAGPRVALLRRVGGEEPVGAVSRPPRVPRR